MSDYAGMVEKLVVKIDCGTKMGNGFLINSNQVLTVKHCIEKSYEENAEIKVTLPPSNEQRAITRVAYVHKNFKRDEDELVLLTFEQEMPYEDGIDVGIIQLKKSNMTDVFGYDKNFRAEGRWTRLISVGKTEVDKDFIQDMLFHPSETKETDFSGLSGSPIVMGKYIIGIVSLETIENKQAIAIHGISMKSYKNFLRNYNIRFEELPSDGILISESESFGGQFRQSQTVITIAGEQVIEKLQGIYMEKLAKISTIYRRGNVKEAWSELKKCVEDMSDDSAVPNKVKAAFYQKMALWYIEDRRDVEKAQKQFEKAQKLDSTVNAKIFHALKESVAGNNTSAEEILEPINNISELNVYLEICINLRKKTEKAILKYKELCTEIKPDASTYYLLSIIEVLNKGYEQAMQYIEEAIKLDDRVPVYHMMQGIILYWKSLPKDVCIEDDLYPVMFANGYFQMEKEQKKLLEKSEQSYRKAYELAVIAQNEEQQEMILSIWINTLSVDDSFQNDIFEPIQLLRRQDELNITVLLYMMLKGKELGEEVTFERLEGRLKKHTNKVGYVIVLVEFSLMKGDKKRAKSYLHEYKSILNKTEYLGYWYEYIAKVEERIEKLADYENEIRINTNLDPIRKKRFLCLFMQQDIEKEQEVSKLLHELYEETGSRLDLLNLVSYCLTTRNWNELEKYSIELLDKFLDIKGELYQVQALIGKGSYEEALNKIEELDKQQIPNMGLKLLENRLKIYDELGDYPSALQAGNEMLKYGCTESLILKLSSLYILNGDEENALKILLKAEEEGMHSVELYQRISLSYLTKDKQKTWMYAEKTVRYSNNKPEVILWAVDIASRIGESEQLGLYLHELMVNYPDYNMKYTKSLDEILDFIKEANQRAVEQQQMLLEGKISSHMFVDVKQDNFTYAEYFYKQWNSEIMFPMEYGAHHCGNEELQVAFSEIALDYSSCLLLHELGILEELSEVVDKIALPGTIFGVISEELRRIPATQQDLSISKYELIKYCTESLNVITVESEGMPENESYEEIDIIEVLNRYTAEKNQAVWVSDSEVGADLNTIELITVIYREGKISTDTYNVSRMRLQGNMREEKIEYVLSVHPRLLVNELVLKELKELSILEIVCEVYQVLIFKGSVESAIYEYEEIGRKKYIYEKLEALRINLMYLKEKGKILLLPVCEEKDGFMCTNMVLSLLRSVEKKCMPLCVDDRILTSYSNMEGNLIYNTFDIMKILLLKKKITIEKYSNMFKKLYDKNVRYVIPDEDFLLHAIKISEVDFEKQTLKESEILSVIRKYIAKIFCEENFLSNENLNHTMIPERVHFIFMIHKSSREIIKKIWLSDMQIMKKRVASDWILYHYSQFAYNFDINNINQDIKRMHEVELADFIIAGILLASNEENVDSYYKWLYEWFELYIVKWADMKEQTFHYIKKFINSLLNDYKRPEKRKEVYCIKHLISIGICHMPKEYREIVLEDKNIAAIYKEVYSYINVVLSPNKRIPARIFDKWEKEILSYEENEVLVKEYQNCEFKLSWNNIMPAFPGIVVQWKEKGKIFKIRLYMNFGKRLQHEKKEVRKAEFKTLEPFLSNLNYGQEYLRLLKDSSYKNVEKDIMGMLDLSEKYQISRIQSGIENNWIKDSNTAKWLLPAKPDFFKRLYNMQGRICCIESMQFDDLLSLPINIEYKDKDLCCENKNPVRLLHSLIKLVEESADEEIILAKINQIFSYLDGENKLYGKLFILLLKIVWYMFEKNEVYQNETLENRIIWSYLWADKAMTAIAEMLKVDEQKLEDIVTELEKSSGIDIQTDNFLISAEESDILSPEHMNLFRICITGTLVICEKNCEKVLGIIEKIASEIEFSMGRWMTVGVYIRESMLPHKFLNNIFDSFLAENIFSVLNRIEILVKKREIILPQIGNVQQKIKMELQSILDGERIDLPKLFYLTVLTKEPLEEEYKKMIQQIIEKQILEKDLIMDKSRYRLLAHIVNQLPEDFQEFYLQHESNRLQNLLQTSQEEWYKIYEIVNEIAVIATSEYFLEFWEKAEEILKVPIASELVENIGWLQLIMPYNLQERVRKLRIKLELKV